VPEAAPAPPRAWPGWPGGKRFALVLTHDVETAAGLSRCERLADLEQERGFRSSFGFVPLRYRTPEPLRRTLAARGFEIMVHDLEHDGKLYRSREHFAARRGLINRFLREWGARGFASGSMQHNLPWIAELDVDFDISTYDVDLFEPQRCGWDRIFPLWVQSPDGGGGGFVEMPYTLPQDFTLFVLMRERSNDIWRRKLDWIAGHGGMVLIKTHPDYMAFGPERVRSGYPVEFYADLLDYIRAQYAGQFWPALPSEMARYWRGLQGRTSRPELAAGRRLCQSCRRGQAEGWFH
jgi:hypothetical protein